MIQWRVRLALLALVLTFGVGLWVKRDEVRVEMERRSVSEKAVVREATFEETREIALTQREQAEGGSPLVAALLRREGEPEKDLEIVRQLISQYFTAMQNRPWPPVGDNADLMRAMSGKNPLRLRVIPEGSGVLGADGQLVDRWGTPYHLHKLAESYCEIRAAGAVRKLCTGEELVGRYCRRSWRPMRPLLHCGVRR
jgi:hypothetical protein